VQVVAPQLSVPLMIDDLHALPEPEKEPVGHRLIQEEALHSFDLTQGPLLRARLVRLTEREHLLLINTHQVVCDGWSLGVFVNELNVLYDAFSAGKASPLAPLSIQYADFACWQRDWQSHPEIVAQLAYWREQLRDPLPMMQLASVRPRRKIDGLRTARRQWALPVDLSEAAKRFSHGEGGTLFMVLVAALKVLLYRYLGQEDLRVATNVANRNRPGTEGLIGPLANTVILRTNLAGNPSPREVLRRVRAITLAAFAHQDLPFDELANALERERKLRSSALGRVMILLQNAAMRPVASSRHRLIFEEADPSMMLPLVTTSIFDVILMLRESAHGLVGTCVYNPHLFGPMTIDRLLRDFRNVLEHMVTQPERPVSAIRIPRHQKRSNR
jgi:non-ribosomal peptide synthetase component F